MSAPPAGAAPARPGSPAWVLVAAVALVAVTVLAAVLGVGWYRDARDAAALQDERDRVADTAAQFVVDINTYSSDDIEDLKSTVDAQITGEIQKSWAQQFASLSQLVGAADMTSSAQVLRTGVASLDRDTATVLVVADATVRSSVQDRLRHFRWEISLTRDGDSWLVDDFTPVVD